MIIFLGILLTICAAWIFASVHYLKSMRLELDDIRIENVALKLKLAELIGKINDQS